MPQQGFVKFFGVSSDRPPQSLAVIEEVERAGCHAVCTYPANKRPRSVQSGAIIFMGRYVTDDVRIFGRAVAMAYRDCDDDATPADIARREWRARWPHYIRVRQAEFINGAMRDGVSLEQMIDELEQDTFASTSRNSAAKRGNVDPRQSVSQQSHLELTPRAMQWLNEHLERCFERNGKISAAELAKLD
jgi:hypothetical protein